MRIQPYQFSSYFGCWPMYQGQGELTLDEFNRQDKMVGRLLVEFDIDEPFKGTMCRAFSDKAGLLRYMRKWGLGATDIRQIFASSLTWGHRPSWCVLAYDPTYGNAWSKQGYRRRWYFDTEEEALAFADCCIPAGLRLAEVYNIDKSIL